jgi:hypothetical protein
MRRRSRAVLALTSCFVRMGALVLGGARSCNDGVRRAQAFARGGSFAVADQVVGFLRGAHVRTRARDCHHFSRTWGRRFTVPEVPFLKVWRDRHDRIGHPTPRSSSRAFDVAEGAKIPNLDAAFAIGKVPFVRGGFSLQSLPGRPRQWGPLLSEMDLGLRSLQRNGRKRRHRRPAWPTLLSVNPCESKLIPSDRALGKCHGPASCDDPEVRHTSRLALSELLDLNRTSIISSLVSLEIPKFATVAAETKRANFGIGTLAVRNT